MAKVAKVDTPLVYKKGDTVTDTDAAKTLKNVPEGASVTWADGHKPDTASFGKGKSAQVVVTKNGQSKTIDVTYDVDSSKDIEGKNITKSDTNLSYKKGDSVADTDAAKTLKNVPSDATAAWITKPDTSEIGKGKSAKVEVTFGNGDKQQYDVVYDVFGKPKSSGDEDQDPLSEVVPIKVAPKFEEGKPVTDTDAAKAVTGVPEGATVTWTKGHEPDTSKPGTGKSAQVTVTYKDKSKTIDITYDVTPKKTDEGQAKDPLSEVVPIKVAPKFEEGKPVTDTDAAKAVTGVPEGATVTWTKGHEPDTSKPGTGKSAQVTVTYKDKSKTIDITYDVTPKKTDEGQAKDPLSEVVPIKVAPKFEEGKPVTDTDAAKAITGVPEGATVTWTKGHEPDTSKPGTGKSAQVTVTYKDKSKTIDITYDVTPKKTDEGQAKDPLSEVVPIKVAPKFEEGKPVTDTDAAKAVTGVPEGATVTWTKGHEPDTSNPGTGKSAQVTVTYKDKSKTIDITYDVTPKKTESGSQTSDTPVPAPVKQSKDADTYKPEVKPIKVVPGQTPNPEDAIGNKDKLPAGTTYTWKGNQAPDTSVPGTGSSTIVITYPDGSKSEVQVDVETASETKSSEDKAAANVTPAETKVNKLRANKHANVASAKVNKAKRALASQANKKLAINKQKHLPQTGNHTTALQALGLAVIALTGLAFFDKKKKQD
ncbi:hypothetical protein FC23_GL001308 [Lactobacillus psittaci DSM 15354]|uniref:Gram-positive cocci surface proteins LPxTG domain-containing protein n=1 Tax=Lactobacillus psittaci DSM 15354 TaxID=1122152 RepID=A0A0R1S025_9LACO|nr:hypothetical protein FC23_GL001308 [Lactobacillus psittaci DSM 15354]